MVDVKQSSKISVKINMKLFAPLQLVSTTYMNLNKEFVQRKYEHCVNYILSGLPGLELEPICCFSFLPASYAFPPAVLGLDLDLHQPNTNHTNKQEFGHKIQTRYKNNFLC